MPPPLCVRCRSLIFVRGRYIYVQYITAVLLSYVEKSGQDEAFHMAISITLQQKLYIKNTVSKNVVYSITNQGIDLKILINIKKCMAHIFVTVNFSENCLFMGVIFNY
jgi:hypothetical protein